MRVRSIVGVSSSKFCVWMMLNDGLRQSLTTENAIYIINLIPVCGAERAAPRRARLTTSRVHTYMVQMRPLTQSQQAIAGAHTLHMCWTISPAIPQLCLCPHAALVAHESSQVDWVWVRDRACEMRGGSAVAARLQLDWVAQAPCRLHWRAIPAAAHCQTLR